jgi:hypothetical protein
MTSFGAGTWNATGGAGGFSADLAVAEAGTLADDSVQWRLDGTLN